MATRKTGRHSCHVGTFLIIVTVIQEITRRFEDKRQLNHLDRALSNELHPPSGAPLKTVLTSATKTLDFMEVISKALTHILPILLRPLVGEGGSVKSALSGAYVIQG